MIKAFSVMVMKIHSPSLLFRYICRSAGTAIPIYPGSAQVSTRDRLSLTPALSHYTFRLVSEIQAFCKDARVAVEHLCMLPQENVFRPASLPLKKQWEGAVRTGSY